MLFFSPRFVLLFSMSFLIFFRNLLGSILNPQADPPTFKNLDFPSGILKFPKTLKKRFRSKDGFESVWGLSRAPFGSSWGSPGGLLGAPSGLWIDQSGPPKSSRNSPGPRLAAEDGRGTVVGRIWLVLGAPECLSGDLWHSSERFRT